MLRPPRQSQGVLHAERTHRAGHVDRARRALAHPARDGDLSVRECPLRGRRPRRRPHAVDRAPGRAPPRPPPARGRRRDPRRAAPARRADRSGDALARQGGGGRDRYIKETLSGEGVAGLINDLPAPLRTLVEKVLEQIPGGEERIQELTDTQGGRAAAALGGVLGATTQAIVQVVMMLIAMFFMLIEGRVLVDRVAMVSLR